MNKNNTHWKSQFYQSILNTELQKHLASFAHIITHWESTLAPKDLKRWQHQLANLPVVEDAKVTLSETVTLKTEPGLTEAEKQKTIAVLKNFMPWRKGPFDFFDIHIDTEWRSDLKWKRVAPYIPNLDGKRVLDVGCGSGYHLFRMKQAKAQQVIGIDPTALFFFQFQCIKQYVPELNIHFLPCTLEAMPPTQYFDCVFSMGVLYHRQDPIKFLKELKQQLIQGGKLVLETLIVEGDENTVLVPQGRYAQMRNVWFLPSVDALSIWLKKVGFTSVQCVDVDITSIEEQRATPWMTNHSLSDFLDPTDNTLTVEGYPAPKRAILIAE